MTIGYESQGLANRMCLGHTKERLLSWQKHVINEGLGVMILVSDAKTDLYTCCCYKIKVNLNRLTRYLNWGLEWAFTTLP